MNKQAAISFFNGRDQTAEAVGVSPQAVSGWPDELPRRIADRVIAAVVRAGKSVPAEWISDSSQQDQQAA